MESKSPLCSLSARDRLIVALDCPTTEESRRLVASLGDDVTIYKAGWRLFLQAGMPFVHELGALGKRVFLDLKMDDIAETIETAVGTIPETVFFLTLLGGPATAQAAVRGKAGRENPKLLFVTFLSSLDQNDLPGGVSLEDHILQRAGSALEAGCEGLIASGESVRSIRAKYGAKPIIVTPGIRPAGSGTDDHKRAATPAQAIGWGSDYLVVGRPIWGASNPKAAARAILAEMDEALGKGGRPMN